MFAHIQLVGGRCYPFKLNHYRPVRGQSVSMQLGLAIVEDDDATRPWVLNALELNRIAIPSSTCWGASSTRGMGLR